MFNIMCFKHCRNNSILISSIIRCLFYTIWLWGIIYWCLRNFRIKIRSKILWNGFYWIYYSCFKLCMIGYLLQTLWYYTQIWHLIQGLILSSELIFTTDSRPVHFAMHQVYVIGKFIFGPIKAIKIEKYIEWNNFTIRIIATEVIWEILISDQL